MIQQQYQSKVTTSVSPTEALDKISQVSEWWALDFTGTAKNEGDTFTVTFGDTYVDFKIVDVIPSQQVVWHVTNSHLPWLENKTEWNGTSVKWKVSTEGGLTTIVMTHEGLHPGIECYKNCEEGWDFFVGKSLNQYLNEGEGLPNGKPKCH